MIIKNACCSASSYATIMVKMRCEPMSDKQIILKRITLRQSNVVFTNENALFFTLTIKGNTKFMSLCIILQYLSGHLTKYI